MESDGGSVTERGQAAPHAHEQLLRTTHRISLSSKKRIVGTSRIFIRAWKCVGGTFEIAPHHDG